MPALKKMWTKKFRYLQYRNEKINKLKNPKKIPSRGSKNSSQHLFNGKCKLMKAGALLDWLIMVFKHH
jgi:hypothetical protein